MEKKTMYELVKQYVEEIAPKDATEEQKKKMIDNHIILFIRV
jgi:hypothetical protein